MLPGIYSAANGMDAAQRQQEIIARNLAHAQMPGFRRLVPYFDSASDDVSASDFAGSKSNNQAIDFTPGGLMQTGAPLDFAISGDGFFTIEGPNGPLFTRNGVFQISPEGQLVTTDGLPVAAEQGVITFPQNADLSKLAVGQDGRLSLNNIPLGKLKLVSVANPQNFELVGATLMALPDGDSVLPMEGTLLQGVREQSNVHPVQELVTMIAAMRQHEAAQRSMTALSRAVERHQDLSGGQ
ncbi:MAG: flagellar hook basal-body protein [Planctomycetaceae bacterium]